MRDRATIATRAAAALAVLAAALPAAPLRAQDNCVPGVAWTYTGTAKGTPSIRDDGKTTAIAFAPAGANEADSVVFSSVNPSAAGTYQVNADIDVDHLSDDTVFTLDGATSAAAGRPFAVTMAAGDGGSSGFSRPINTSGQPFTILIKTRATHKISFRIRNYVVCKLR